MLFEHWVNPYGNPSFLFIDDGRQFVARFFEKLHLSMRTKYQTTTAYNQETTGHVRVYDKTLITRLRQPISINQKDWGRDIQQWINACITQVNWSISITTFIFVLSKQPPTVLTMVPWTGVGFDGCSDSLHPVLRLHLLTRTKALKIDGDRSACRTKNWYRKDIDMNVQTFRKLKVCLFIYVSKTRRVVLLAEVDKVACRLFITIRSQVSGQ